MWRQAGVSRFLTNEREALIGCGRFWGTNTTSDTFNFTVSVDRPTFIRFLNKNRTFFFNSQVFLQYIPKWSESFVSNGPVTARLTFSVFTDYMQDRLLPGFTAVYDWYSRSGAHKSWTQQGLSLIRDRDEFYFRARYRF